MIICVSLVVGYAIRNESRIYAEEAVYILQVEDQYKILSERIFEIESVLESELQIEGVTKKVKFSSDEIELEALAIEYEIKEISLTNLSIVVEQKFHRLSYCQLFFSNIEDFKEYINSSGNLIQREYIPALIKYSDSG